MLPLKDDIPSRHYPVVTLTLIVVNTLFFFYEILLGERLEPALYSYGVVPVRYTRPEIAQFFSIPEQIVPLFSSMFLHGGWLHLIGNMWILWIFGDNVEDILGRFRFLVFYLLGGVIAAALHVLTNAHSMVPTIGASGAVAGIMGAYFRYFPHAHVMMLIPPFFLGPFFNVPAVLFLGWWFFLQFFNGTLTLGMNTSLAGGVAWWAHVGGFVFGVLLVSLFVKRKPWVRYGDGDED